MQAERLGAWVRQAPDVTAQPPSSQDVFDEHIEAMRFVAQYGRQSMKPARDECCSCLRPAGHQPYVVVPLGRLIEDVSKAVMSVLCVKCALRAGWRPGTPAADPPGPADIVAGVEPVVAVQGQGA